MCLGMDSVAQLLQAAQMCSSCTALQLRSANYETLSIVTLMSSPQKDLHELWRPMLLATLAGLSTTIGAVLAVRCSDQQRVCAWPSCTMSMMQLSPRTGATSPG